MPNQIFVRKAAGDLVPYDPDKVRESLQRAMVDDALIEDILKKVNPKVTNGMSTKELYSEIYSHLHTNDAAAAAKYNLKQAIMELGPSGYPFEQFLAGVLRHIGYQTWTNQIVKGKCVTHEIDIIAERNNIHYMVEAKYHNLPGRKTTIQEALYTHARFLDVEDRWKETEPDEEAHAIHRGWLITNTKLSSDAIEYANCIGLEVSSWDYPTGTSLRKLITSSGAHPITSLHSLTEEQVNLLLKANKVLCMDLIDMENKEIEELGLQAAYEEAKGICFEDVEIEEDEVQEPQVFIHS